MILTGIHARLHRWCFDTYGYPRPVRWFKGWLLETTSRYYERHLPMVW